MKKKLFCYYYAKLQDHREAAIKAGIPKHKAEEIGLKLIAQKGIRERINKIIEEDKKYLTQKMMAGLKQIAFGSVSDSVKLIAKSGEIDDLSDMNFYNISEIKKMSNGGFEIKFFNRFEAFEKLMEMLKIDFSESEKENFFEAIKESAKGLKDNGN